ncbi:MAG TPA: hypothetical protein VEC16_01550 [Alphaproteobacteria bacterium]|nr:hypothetical protein [Alphaproteobacteria bacterium]
MDYNRLDDSQMESEFKSKEGIIIKRPSLKDYNQTIGCALEPNSTLPNLTIKVIYTQSISDYLHARGMVPAKTTYEVKIENFVKDQNSVSSKSPGNDLGKIISDTEQRFMKINNLDRIKAEVVYTVIAKSGNKIEIIPREIYLPHTYLGKRLSK